MLTRLIFIILFFGSAGCSPNLPFLSQQAKPQNNTKEAVLNSIDKIHTKETKTEKLEIDPRLAKILKSPSLIANKKNIEAAQKTVLIVKSQTEPVVTAISNIGPKLDNDDLDLDATGGLSITKLISDGGVVRAMSSSAELNVRASELLYAQNINSQLMEVVKAEQAIINFGKIEAIYNEQLAVYNDNLPLIQTAAKANIISKTDVLKLEQLKLKSEESYLTAKTGADAAKLLRKKYNFDIVEDASHALGAKYPSGEKVGCCKYSLATVFSFHPVKIIASGEGGIITTNNKDFYEKLISLRSHGMIRENNKFLNKDLKKSPFAYEIHDLGLNYRITDIQSALAISQLNRIDRFISKRKKIAKIYDKFFSKIPYIELPQRKFRNISSNHLYIIRLNFKQGG